jgi:hypothetical protein
MKIRDKKTNTIYTVNLDWNIKDYNKIIPGKYDAEATYDIPAEIDLPDGFENTVKASVTVKESAEIKYEQSLEGIYKWLSDIDKNPSLDNKNRIITVSGVSIEDSTILLPEYFKNFPYIPDNIYHRYNSDKKTLQFWEGDIEGFTPQDDEAEYAKSVQATRLMERKDYKQREARRNVLLTKLKNRTRKNLDKYDISEVSERNRFIDESVSDFLDTNNTVTNKRIEHKETGKHTKLYRKIRNGLSGMWQKWRQQKMWVKLPIVLGAGIGGAAALPAWGPYIGLGLMGLGAAGLQPAMRTLGYRGVKRKGIRPALGDYSLSGATDFTARVELKEGMTEPPGEKGIDVLRSPERMASYHNAVSTKIKERVNTIEDIDNYADLSDERKEEIMQDILRIMNEEFDKIWKSIEKQRTWLLARKMAESAGAALGIAAIGNTVRYAVGELVSAAGFGSETSAGEGKLDIAGTESVEKSIGGEEGPAGSESTTGGEAAAGAEEGVSGTESGEGGAAGGEGSEEGAAGSETGEENVAGAESESEGEGEGEGEAAGPEALISPDASFEAEFSRTINHPNVYDPNRTLLELNDSGVLTDINDSVSPTAGTEVEVSTLKDNLVMRTAGGEIIDSVPKGDTLELTGNTKTFEIINRADNSEKLIMTYFEAKTESGQTGYFAGSFLKAK